MTEKLFGQPCKLYIDAGHVTYSVTGANLDMACDPIIEGVHGSRRPAVFKNTCASDEDTLITKDLYIYDVIVFADAYLLCNVTRNPKARGIAGFAKDTPHFWFVTKEPLEEKLGMVNNDVRIAFVRNIEFYPGQWEEGEDGL